MAKFTGQLNANEIYASLFNMIISIVVYSGNIKGGYTELVDQARADGSMYGDTKLYVDTDVLACHDWLGDAEAPNLLALDRPADPEVQKITLDVFKQIRLTTDEYLSKRAWGDEYAFAQFNGTLKGWIRDTKKVYDLTLYNSFIGTKESAVQPSVTVDLTGLSIPSTNVEREAFQRLSGQMIGEAIANLVVDLKDVSRAYNDYKHLKSHSGDEIKVVWNSKFINQIRYLDLPTIFHKDSVTAEINFKQYMLPARYFGNVVSAAGTSDGTTHRTMIERTIKVNNKDVEFFPGDLLPAGVSFTAGSVYVQDETIVCKVLTELPPYMSAFEVGTSFFNQRSLTENFYLTFGHNTLEYLEAKPFVTMRVQNPSAQQSASPSVSADPNKGK